MRHVQSRGFVGIISILIVVVLIGAWLYYFSPLAGTKPTIEQERSIGIEAIEAAEGAKHLIESRPTGL